MDPQEVAAQHELDLGTDALSRGDFQTALTHYKKSVEIKQTSIGPSLSPLLLPRPSHLDTDPLLDAQATTTSASSSASSSLPLHVPLPG